MAENRLFARVRRIALTFPGVASVTKHDGSPRLTLGGCFMAGLATHPSAEPGSLVVRCSLDERDGLLADAPDAFYVTDYYARWPIVLARLKALDDDQLRDLLAMSRTLTEEKAGRKATRPRTSHPGPA